jgi:pyruvate/2-oxoglutarate dehydrogenase complex dihydrolipoamide dehydrogenase (E3) component
LAQTVSVGPVMTEPVASPVRSRPVDGHHDLIVVGGGSGGLAAARAGVRAGRRTLLIQDGEVGGDCTFTGCIPSKTLIESARQGVGFTAAMTRVAETVARVAATETAAVLVGEGIAVVEGRARFTGPRRLQVGARAFSAERVVVATGSAPARPDIAGLDTVPFLTNETVFGLRERPARLVVIGGGPIGSELGQAFGRLGSDVVVVEGGPRLLAREEPEASAVLARWFASQGISVRVATTVCRLAPRRGPGGSVVVELSDGTTLEADALLVASGRRAVTDGLDPGAGGIDLDDTGSIRTDDRLATTASGVYAVGDVTGRLRFTHAADEMGRLAVANAFSRFPRRFDTRAVPWVTFTDPEVARVGMTEEQAVGRGVRVAQVPMAAVDRAVTAGRTEGFVKLIAGPRPVIGSAGGGRLLGATIVGPRAGEMIGEAALAVRTAMFVGRLAQTVHAYPTWSMALRQAAAQFFMEEGGRRARPARSNQGPGQQPG